MSRSSSDAQAGCPGNGGSVNVLLGGSYPTACVGPVGRRARGRLGGPGSGDPRIRTVDVVVCRGRLITSRVVHGVVVDADRGERHAGDGVGGDVPPSPDARPGLTVF